MLVIRDSFSPYAAFTDAGQFYWDIAAGGFMSSSTRFGTGQSVNPTTGFSLRKASPRNEDTVFAALSHDYDFGLSPSPVRTIGLYVMDGFTPQVTVVWRIDGAIEFRRGDQNGALLGTWNGAYPGQSWQNFQFKFVINSSTGEIRARRNGATSDTYSLTGINTQATANAYANAFQFGNLDIYADRVLIQDVWFWDANNASAPYDWIGDVKSIWLPPVSDSSVQFTPSTGVLNYAMVDELIQDGGSTYVYSSTPGDTDLYGVQAVPTSPTPVSVIKGLSLRGFAAKDDSGTRELAMTMNSGGTPADGPTVTLGTTYQNLVFPQDTDPDTGLAWNVSAVNALLIGQKVIS